MQNNDIKVYLSRIEELEEKVEQLRLSRRILMNILENLDKERRVEIKKVREEQKRLKQANIKYAYNLLKKNAKVMELEKKLQT